MWADNSTASTSPGPNYKQKGVRTHKRCNIMPNNVVFYMVYHPGLSHIVTTGHK